MYLRPSVFLFVSGLFLPVAQAQTWRGCVSDNNYSDVNYHYIVEQVGSGATAYATIRGTVTSSNSTSTAFPGTMNGYIASKTSDIYFTVVYGNKTGSRFYVIDRNGVGISWAVDATGAISSSAQPIQIKNCSKPTCSPQGRWCDNDNGTITDTTTGLVWLQDASWGGKNIWSDAGTLAAQVQNGNPAWVTDGSQAGQWRLPTKDELVAFRTGTESVLSSHMYLFTGVQMNDYWSSTTDGPTYAWLVDMYSGYVDSYLKTAHFYVWPVRGGQ
ncbi:MAG: DUF1566 domain-containing protein [Deltaproteobacteria bacterium]|nr:DUF1566 domain-containing protein [Deltaproteobacteria bacterium]MBF0524885.1 DUF1566 domain-containing protein [Deltaproteobacteria bacterium]